MRANGGLNLHRLKFTAAGVRRRNMHAPDAKVNDDATDGLAPVQIAIASQESLNIGKPVKVDSV